MNYESPNANKILNDTLIEFSKERPRFTRMWVNNSTISSYTWAHMAYLCLFSNLAESKAKYGNYLESWFDHMVSLVCNLIIHLSNWNGRRLDEIDMTTHTLKDNIVILWFIINQSLSASSKTCDKRPQAYTYQQYGVNKTLRYLRMRLATA